MRISEISLQNYRNFNAHTIQFTQPTCLVTAPNTSGKTNLLEAIFYFAVGKSFRADLEQELIQTGKLFASMEAQVQNKDGVVKLRAYLEKAEGGTLLTRKRLEVNDVARKLFNFVGNFQAVLFTPEDLNLIIDSPSVRRKYLDTVISQVNTFYHKNSIQYQKIITQRNKLLERIREGCATIEQLFYWNEKLLRLGMALFEERKQVIIFLNREMKKISISFSEHAQELEIIYYPSLLTAERLQNYEKKEIDAGQSLIGPHRDDFGLFWKGYDLAKYGSRGEQRLSILALKMAELKYIKEKVGESPVLLLDDIFSELDLSNREKLLLLFNRQQTILTTTEEEIVHVFPRPSDIQTIHLNDSVKR